MLFIIDIREYQRLFEGLFIKLRINKNAIIVTAISIAICFLSSYFCPCFPTTTDFY